MEIPTVVELLATPKIEQSLSLDGRCIVLERKLKEKGFLDERVVPDGRKKKSNLSRAESGRAIKISSEFLSAIGVGALLGEGLDRLTDLSPWGLVIFLFLGFIAGILNVVRSASVEDNAVQKKGPEE